VRQGLGSDLFWRRFPNKQIARLRLEVSAELIKCAVVYARNTVRDKAADNTERHTAFVGNALLSQLGLPRRTLARLALTGWHLRLSFLPNHSNIILTKHMIVTDQCHSLCSGLCD
jgi:hypothetical protein